MVGACQLDPQALVSLDVPSLDAHLRLRRLTDSALAHNAGVSKGTLSRARHGRPMRLCVVARLATALNANVDCLARESVR